MPAPVLLWFRQDLRLADNPALHEVGDRPVLPVFVLDDVAAGAWASGGAARWWLRRSLEALGAALAAAGAPLLLRRGAAEALIPELAARIDAEEVLAGRLYEPWARARDRRVQAALQQDGRRLRVFPGLLLHEPAHLATGAGRPYAVYAPFARALEARGAPPPPLPARRLRLHGVAGAPRGEALARLGLYPVAGETDWAASFPDLWTPGGAGAQARLRRIARPAALRRYAEARNLPGAEASSGLSPHLHWGEVSPRQLWHAVQGGAEGDAALARPFLSELLWREYSHHLLWHHPAMPEAPLRPEFARFPWQRDRALLHAWQQGRTGYPLVDAGMRQLRRLGWMHNRVRMVAASLLVKHLLQPWQDGAAWFWDNLVDADLANNSMNWQWVAGSGSDAAPYFRVFNPARQGETFDPEGHYVRRFVPELARLPDRHIHRPWDAPDAALRAAGIVLGRDYPRPLVELGEGRQRALAAFAAMRGARATDHGA